MVVSAGDAYLDNFEVASARMFGWPMATDSRDLNKDGLIDWLDIKIMSEHWLQTGTEIAGDVNNDGTVDFADFATLATGW